MQSHRDGVPVLVCDGCYRVLGEAEYEPEADRFFLKDSALEQRFTYWTTPEGRKGHVCSQACGEKFNAKPVPRRAAVPEPVVRR